MYWICRQTDKCAHISQEYYKFFKVIPNKIISCFKIVMKTIRFMSKTRNAFTCLFGKICLKDNNLYLVKIITLLCNNFLTKFWNIIQMTIHISNTSITVFSNSIKFPGGQYRLITSYFCTLINMVPRPKSVWYLHYWKNLLIERYFVLFDWFT